VASLEIPIRYTERPGSDPADITTKSPTVEVVIGFDPNADMNDQKQPTGKFIKVTALIDTGADDIFVDEVLLSRCDCPKVSKTAHVKTVHLTTGHEVFLAHFFFPASGLKTEMEVIASKIQDGTRAYAAVFGTRFLELGRLVIDPKGKSHFVFHQSSTTLPVEQAGPLVED
jgi:predicted aspartyl protease